MTGERDTFERALTSIEESFQAVGGYMLQAMEMVAEEVGDLKLRDRVMHLAQQEPHSILPHPDGLALLVEGRPGIGNYVLDRAQEIQEATHQEERRALRRMWSPLHKPFWRAMLFGVSHIGVSPRPPRPIDVDYFLGK
ncbi:MAG TPA: hypothetical protein VG992_02855 [Candidatus Saccharimonadales bacterium]|nr:hypothetical protein [Candidatus Saccharimonadales bacterium]